MRKVGILREVGMRKKAQVFSEVYLADGVEVILKPLMM